MRPARTPTGLELARAARAVSRAFGDALAEAGGSLPAWLILLNLKTRRVSSQRELAEAVGVREATLTHHLNAMDAQGLVTRARDPANRRVHVVERTPAGEAAFLRLRDAATAFDRRLRDGLTDTDLDTLARLVTHLAGRSQFDDVDAPVRRIPGTGDQALGVQGVEVVGEGSLPYAHRPGQFALAGHLAGLQAEQDQPHRQRAARLGQCVVEGAADRPGGAGQFQADGGSRRSHAPILDDP